MLARAGHSLISLSPVDGVHLMLNFYRTVRTDGFRPDIDSDSLLFQWSGADSAGGSRFDFDIARQFYKIEDNSGGFTVHQLHLAFIYDASPEFRALGSGSRWCHNPSDADAFEQFALSSPACRSALAAAPKDVVIQYAEV